MQKTAASQRRRPFSVSTGHGSTYIYCSNHTEEIATFYCLQCHKPFGEDCVGKESGENTICRTCVDADKEKRGRSARRKRQFKRALRTGLTVAVLAMLSVNSYVLIRYSPTSTPTPEPEMSAQLTQLIECRHRLEMAAHQASFFVEQLGHPPTSMDDLAVMIDDRSLLKDPITKSDFLIDYDPVTGIRVISAHPEAYGLRALFAQPGKPATMEYL